jgi:hypothetical protein
VGLFDSTEEHPPAKVRRYVITGLAFVLLVVLGCWYLLRYHAEKNAVRQFLNTVAVGKMDDAYRIWKPSGTYSLKDFNDDWGPNSYYGPVKSFRIEGAGETKCGVGAPTGAVITVKISPYDTFPSDNDVEKQNKTKEVRLWIQYDDHSFSFPPC